MPLDLPPEEPEAAPWHREPLTAFAARLLLPDGGPRPRLLALDGRSANGKSTTAARFAALLPRTAVVHTDDLAWNHSRFGWTDLLVALLDQVRAGRAVAYRPPAWDGHDRPGAVEVPAALDLLVVEGVGAGRAEHRPLFDATVWLQSDRATAEHRDLARIGRPDGARDAAARLDWLAEEDPFLAAARPWEHADAILCGTPPVPYDPDTEVVVGTRRPAGGPRPAGPGGPGGSGSPDRAD